MARPDFSHLHPGNIVDFIGDIFSRRGAESYLGEDVTMSQHMLQTAQLAEQAGASDMMITAALLHDIGHYTSEFAPNAADEGIDNRHETAGAAVLGEWFPPEVTEAVRCHVDAKRYLCATDPNYFDGLSEASVLSLKLQGGPMTSDEVTETQKNPYLETIVQVRIWDDLAKDRSVETPFFEYYAPIVQRVVSQHAASRKT